jgi:hypothetical protein
MDQPKQRDGGKTAWKFSGLTLLDLGRQVACIYVLQHVCDLHQLAKAHAEEAILQKHESSRGPQQMLKSEDPFRLPSTFYEVNLLRLRVCQSRMASLTPQLVHFQHLMEDRSNISFLALSGVLVEVHITIAQENHNLKKAIRSIDGSLFKNNVRCDRCLRVRQIRRSLTPEKIWEI